MLFLTVQIAQCEPILKEGQRMVFYGDSITQQMIYTGYVMDYFALHYPESEITFRNAGWSGDKAPLALIRLQRDVLSLKPDVVSMCFGMNDAAYTEFNQERFDTYMQSMAAIISELKKADVKVVLLTPGCVDPDKGVKFPPIYNDTLARYADGVKELAVKENLPVYDIYRLMLDVQRKGKANDSGFTMIPDGIHPNEIGHTLMAFGLVNALGCSYNASGLEVDAVKSTIIPDRCSVKNLKLTADAVSFTRKDDSLPVYIDQSAEILGKIAPYVYNANKYLFKVTGLKQGNWKLSVQGMEVGIFSADKLAVGVNLAYLPGPWKKLADDVHSSTKKQEQTYYLLWRSAWDIYPVETKPEVEALKQKFADVISMQEDARRKLVSARTWNWSLTFEK